MEEQKLAETSGANRRNFNLEGGALWQWQSDIDPWKDKDPANWTWENYTYDACLIIEEAFSLDKPTADLGGYVIDFKKMLQVNKQFQNRIRRVRRQEKSRFMMEMPVPRILSKDQKTMNDAFGTIQHFLDYIMKRTTEAYRLYQRLRGLPLECKYNEFQDIIQDVVDCVQKGAEAREKIVKTRSVSPVRSDFTLEAHQIIENIQKNSACLRDFLRAILKAYTMETFICYWLNELLRSENWEEMNVLTPYLVCLVYTFKLSDYIIKYEEPKGFIDSLFGIVFKQTLSLYRGAALTKEHLELYDPERVKHFSWNGVTSTSRSKEIARKFVKMAMGQAKKQGEDKQGIVFLIETDFSSAKDCEGMIDTSQNSQYPDEKEIILAPGTVFELIKTSLVEDDIYEISLRVKKKFEETKENIALLGALQDQAILKDKAIIDDFPSQKSFKILQLLEGNKLVRKFEVRNSKITQNILEIIEDTRVTTNVKKEDVHFMGNRIEVKDLGALARYFKAENLNEICTLNDVIFTTESDSGREIKEIILREDAIERLRLNGQLKHLWKGIGREVRNMNISMETVHISNGDFLERLSQLEALESLRLTFYPEMENEGLKKLCAIIQNLHALKNLSLGVRFSDEGLNLIRDSLMSRKKSLQHLSLDIGDPENNKLISDWGLVALKNILENNGDLHSLSLNLQGCQEISDKGLGDLKVGLGVLLLGSLQKLSLNFERCGNITDEGLNHLKTALKLSRNLQSLELNFNNCNKISDDGLTHLCDAIKSSKTMQHLSLGFKDCKMITDKGLCLLNSVLLEFESLKHLSLHFEGCLEISDEGLMRALERLKSLQYLSLNFGKCHKISNEGLGFLKNQLPSLNYLSLDFSQCQSISDQGIINHLQPALLQMKSLNHLSLNLTECQQISDETLTHLKDSFTTLKSLHHFSLNFSDCIGVSDGGLNSLHVALQSLTSLQNLSLHFIGCLHISDEGLNHINNAISHLPSLKHLSLNFEGCLQISDEGLNHLKSGITSLISLEYLSLDFTRCILITDNGLKNLKDALTPLVLLRSLSLHFIWCIYVSDEGLKSLSDAIASFTFLKHLEMSFENCDKISDRGMSQLSSAIDSVKSLQHLSLNLEKCYGMSGQCLESLKKSIEGLMSLQKISINLLGCTSISNESVNDLRKALSSSASLKKIWLRKQKDEEVAVRTLKAEKEEFTVYVPMNG